MKQHRGASLSASCYTVIAGTLIALLLPTVAVAQTSLPVTETYKIQQLKLSSCLQSSTTIPASVCEKAIDGNLNQFADKYWCTHTNLEASWWVASTEKLARVREVKIYNRLDCCSDRLNDFVVTVDGHECGSYNSTESFNVTTFKCDVIGQAVMIKPRKPTYLSLCEVQVFGAYVTRTSSQLKLSSCQQSSTTIPASVCEKAIDGNLNQFADKYWCTHTNLEASWWKASTEKLARVTEVKIFNRLDCCSDRLTDFVVTVDGYECGSYNTVYEFSVLSIKCDIIGQTIMIKTRKPTYLSLCEVQVFGEFVTDSV